MMTFSYVHSLMSHEDLRATLSEVDQSPHFEVPYPTTNGDNNIRRASGSCPFQPLHILKKFKVN